MEIILIKCRKEVQKQLRTVRHRRLLKEAYANIGLLNNLEMYKKLCGIIKQEEEIDVALVCFFFYYHKNIFLTILL